MIINVKTFIKMTTPDYPLGRIFVVDDTDVSKTVFKSIDELVVLEPATVLNVNWVDSNNPSNIMSPNETLSFTKIGNLINLRLSSITASGTFGSATSFLLCNTLIPADLMPNTGFGFIRVPICQYNPNPTPPYYINNCFVCINGGTRELTIESTNVYFTSGDQFSADYIFITYNTQ